ncbi:MAG: TIGR03943 family protein [Candidatus Dojkabacteria bacterium]
MKEIYSFLTIGTYSLWIVLSAFVQNTLSYYTTDRYYNLILVAALASFVICIVGMIYNGYRLRKSFKKGELLKFALILFIGTLGILFNNILLILLPVVIFIPVEILIDRKFIFIIVLCIAGFIFLPTFILAAIGVFIPFKNNKVDEYLNKNFFSSLLVIVIISLGLVLPSQALSSNIADQRADNLNTVSVTSGQDITKNFSTGTKNYGIGDWIASLNFNPDPNFYKGKEVEVVGFIFTPKIIDADTEFLIGRFVIRCCAADATPVGLKVKFKWNDKFKAGDWVKVTGIFEVSENNGNEDLYINPVNVEPTNIPNKPYIT